MPFPYFINNFVLLYNIILLCIIHNNTRLLTTNLFIKFNILRIFITKLVKLYVLRTIYFSHMSFTLIQQFRISFINYYNYALQMYSTDKFVIHLGVMYNTSP